VDAVVAHNADFNPKPQKKAFELALDKCRKAGDDLRPEECMLIDDNLETIKTAKAMGFQTLWIHPDYTDGQGKSNSDDSDSGDPKREDDDDTEDDDIAEAKRVHELPRVCPQLFPQAKSPRHACT
jgi:FMN phosphatase YigB (HAD superfamily)